jgi:TPP-dependent pyruvate/acetoin dehydrogenase alpha subunit
VADWEARIQAEVDADIARAFQDPWPDPRDLVAHVY